MPDPRMPRAGGSLLLELRPVVARPPFFCVGPMNGLLGILGHLASALSAREERAFYALQAPGMDGREPPLRRVDPLAARCVEEVRAFQSEGPYVIGGYAWGGVVAYEMARQLRAQGAEVARVVLLDTPLPGRTDAPVEASRAVVVRELVDMFGGISSGAAAPSDEEIAGMSAGEQVALVQEALERVEAILDPDAVERLVETYAASMEAILGHRPGPLDAPVTLFTAETPLVMPLHPSRRMQTHETSGLGWETVCADVLRIRPVPGDHLSMLQPPNVDWLASLLAHDLSGAASAALRPWASCARAVTQ